MSKISKVKKSREKWKKKAIKRGADKRYEKKEKLRMKKERDQYKKEAQELQKKLDNLNNLPSIENKVDVIFVSIQLFLVARIGFRAVSRVLGVLGAWLGITKIPCPQTIINWLIRLSIARMKNINMPMLSSMEGAHFSNGLICLIDISIGLGAGKILALTGLPMDHHARSPGAPTLASVKCVAVAVADSWNGEKIADFLETVIARIGGPVAFLKDGGTDLGKAVRLLNERGVPSVSIADISHKLANLLKHAYQNHPMFNLFLKCCGLASKKLKQTILACLAPPKVSTKARFMNLHRLVRWAEKILRHSPRGRAAKGSILSKLRKGINQLPKCKKFITEFLRDANALLEIQQILKTRGLSHETYRECQQVIECLPPRSTIREGFISWAEDQLRVAAELGLSETGMPICSDAIESLYGVAKRHGTGEIKDVNRIALRIPALCGEFTREDAEGILDVSVQEQQEIEKSFPSFTKQRREVLPNPGTLDQLRSDGTPKANLELIPGSKSRSKNLEKPVNSICYVKENGPPQTPKKIRERSQYVEILQATPG